MVSEPRRPTFCHSIKEIPAIVSSARSICIISGRAKFHPQAFDSAFRRCERVGKEERGTVFSGEVGGGGEIWPRLEMRLKLRRR